MNRLLALLFVVTFLIDIATGEDESPAPAGAIDFTVLETRDGRRFRDCIVKRSTDEGLIIEHADGMALISFFDLSDEIRDQYGFDPVLAMKAHRSSLERSRALQKKQVLEQARIQAERDRREAVVRLQAVAVGEWLPVEARILSVTETGAYALIDRIILKPTTVTSALGFKNPGPARRVKRPVREAPLFLRNPDHSFEPDTVWKGYLEPFPTAMETDPNSGEKSVPVHLAVPPP